MSIAKHWCFTLNNYVEDELVALRKSLQEEKTVQFGLFGKETGESGTPHLQGYVCFHKKKRITGVKKVVGKRAHVEVCKGTPQQNISYCSKTDLNPERFGTEPVPRHGKRTDLDQFKEDVKSGEYTKQELKELHTGIYARYPRFFNEYIDDNKEPPKLPSHPLNEWQAWLSSALKLPPDDRKVCFIVDREGNRGKSWFSHYYCRLHDNAQVLRPTKHADMAYALKEDLRVLFLDCTRTQVEYLPYTFIEECKDGYVFSNKYESKMKLYDRMHVVVLMNQWPDETKLSRDRYHIVDLDKEY